MTALRLLPEFEAALRAVPGIREASVRTGPDAHPIEVHVVAGGIKPAKQVVRDVQSVAMAQFDLDIDHRIVSVVQIPDDAVEVGEPTTEPVSGTASASDSTGPRPALTSITTERRGSDAIVSVTLCIDGSAFSGTADGPASAVHRPRVVAAATLAALTELLGIEAHVDSSQILELGMREVAVTTLVLEIPRLGQQAVCGSALVRGDAEDAVARSVLAAVNRRLSG